MVVISLFYLISVIILFTCLTSRVDKLKKCEEMLQITENANSVYEERLETFKAKQLHLNYLIAEKNEELDKLRKEVIELNVKLSNKKKRK